MKKYVFSFSCLLINNLDLIVLSMTLNRKLDVSILREPKDSEIEKVKYKDKPFLYLNIGEIRKSFLKEFLKDVDDADAVDEQRLFYDYMFLSSNIAFAERRGKRVLCSNK